MTFYTSVAKRLKLNVRKFLGLIPTFVEVTGEKLVGWPFWVNNVNMMYETKLREQWNISNSILKRLYIELKVLKKKKLSFDVKTLQRSFFITISVIFLTCNLISAALKGTLMQI